MWKAPLLQEIVLWKRRRRDNIKDMYTSLKDEIPNFSNDRASRAQILKKTIDQIQESNAEVEELNKELKQIEETNRKMREKLQQKKAMKERDMDGNTASFSGGQ
uniref:BHLH domain-containing protein n=1 Tax=Ditylenchus dipsaci TaxID=166011 RepID=A0A915CWP1_9BILA